MFYFMEDIFQVVKMAKIELYKPGGLLLHFWSTFHVNCTNNREVCLDNMSFNFWKLNLGIVLYPGGFSRLKD